MLTTKSRYAVVSLVDIANRIQIEPVKLSDISRRQNIPVGYLEQIFCKLKNAGLVKAIKGPGGGYKLAKDLKEINIKQIIDAVDEKIQITKCGNNPLQRCINKNIKCLTHDFWQGLTEHIASYLSSISIEDIINKKILNENNEIL
jgi:Rrf2 family iron-sulfur cluster assembly transcriptional regulator